MPAVLPAATFTLAPCDLDLVDELRRELRCTETLAWVLARRGVTAAAARTLLTDDAAADEAALHDPLLLGDMTAAVERIRYAIDAGEQIVVHGDYDADGVCATTLLVESLETLGARVEAFLPDRMVHGYGLGIDQIEQFAASGARLLIAVDCGITAVEPVDHANDLGLDVIICDHHEPAERLPAAILCSTRPSSYPFPELCATAVVGKLVTALAGSTGPRQHELEAIATIADCMPLVGENRALVRRGLRALRSTDRPGLMALAAQAGVRVADIDSDAVGFKLAPRLNAVGRISRSERAYELLRAGSATAPALADQVGATNEERRAVEQAITAAALEEIDGWSDERRASRIYVVHGRDWHPGVVGIVASRLVERHARPVIVIGEGDPARGSGRSIDGVNLHSALAACDDVLVRWGGHAQAAGVTIDPTRIDELQLRLARWAEEHVDESLLTPRDRVDAVLSPADVTFELAQELERLAPFGTGWTRPLLVALDAQIDGATAIGGDGTHLRCSVRIGDQHVSGIGFGMAELMPALADTRVDVALRPSINRFRGSESLQVQLHRCYGRAATAGTDRKHNPGNGNGPGPGPGANPGPGPGPDLTTDLCVRVPGWCVERCELHAVHRVSLDDVVVAATGMLPTPFDDDSSVQRPALEPLLARAGAVDLRARGHGVSTVSQLVTAGARVLVLVADVEHGIQELRPVVADPHLPLLAAAVVSEHARGDVGASRLQVAAAAAASAAAGTPGAMLVIGDHASIDIVLGGALQFDAIVLLDPPMSTAQRDRIARAPAGMHVYLTFGAAEQRRADTVVARALDVRGNLKHAYRQLRDHGPLEPHELEQAVFGAAEPRRSPASVTYGLRTLLGRGILELDTRGRLSVVETPVPAASTST